MEGWRGGISGAARPSPAVPVHLAPLTSRRGNPEAAAAAAPQKHCRTIAVPIILLVYSISLRTRQTLVTVAILHTQPYLSIAALRPSRFRASLGRVNTLHTTRRDSHRHTLAFDAHTQPLEAAL